MVVWQALQVHRTCSHCGGVPHPADEVTPKAHPTPWTTVRGRGHLYYLGCPGDTQCIALWATPSEGPLRGAT